MEAIKRILLPRKKLDVLKFKQYCNWLTCPSIGEKVYMNVSIITHKFTYFNYAALQAA